MGDPLDLRGQSQNAPRGGAGKVIKALRDTQSKNPVILLDEIDRVTDAGRSSIMGVLVELLDPRQNYAFSDHYIDFLSIFPRRFLSQPQITLPILLQPLWIGWNRF